MFLGLVLIAHIGKNGETSISSKEYLNNKNKEKHTYNRMTVGQI